MVLEKLYGTDLHDRGTTLPDPGLRNVPRETLACLHPDEIGDPQYTIEGWLVSIESANKRINIPPSHGKRAVPPW